MEKRQICNEMQVGFGGAGLHSFNFFGERKSWFLAPPTSGIQSKVVHDVVFHNGMCFPRLEILFFFKWKFLPINKGELSLEIGDGSRVYIVC